MDLQSADEADQAREQRQVHGDHGEQDAAADGGMLGGGVPAEVGPGKLRPLEAVISRAVEGVATAAAAPAPAPTLMLAERPRTRDYIPTRFLAPSARRTPAACDAALRRRGRENA